MSFQQIKSLVLRTLGICAGGAILSGIIAVVVIYPMAIIFILVGIVVFMMLILD